MEWTQQQQLLLLLQSACLGMGIGLLFDVFTGIGRAARRRWVVFLLDVLFGVLAAFITFFTALGIMNGAMHPLLFLGGLFGFLAEHSSVGIYCSRGICAGLRRCGRIGKAALDAGERWLLVAAGFLASFFKKKTPSEENVKKRGKKLSFFQKKT